MSGDRFREIYKHFNIKMNKRDHESVIGFLQEKRRQNSKSYALEQEHYESNSQGELLNARYDLKQIAKLVDHLASEYYRENKDSDLSQTS